MDNILLDYRGSAVLCDFNAASPFALTSLVLPEYPLRINGPLPYLSMATCIFAMSSLMFQLEHGVKPKLSVRRTSGGLILPVIQTNHQDIDKIIQKTWLGIYSTTSEMLNSLSLLHVETGQGDALGYCNFWIPLEAASLPRERIRAWRREQEDSDGKNIDCIMYALFLTIYRLCARWYTLGRSVACAGRLLWLG